MITRRNFIKISVKALVMGYFLSFFNSVNRVFASRKARGKSECPGSSPENISKLVIVQNEKATSWDYKAERYLDYIDQDIVDEMVDEGICRLTGSDRPEIAWQKIMASYTKGDKVAIKPNFNNINHGYRECFTSPQVINSVIKGLVDHLKIPEKNIFVYDLCKKIPKSLIRDRIGYRVNYIERLDPGILKDKLKLRLGLDLSCADKNQVVEMRNKIMDSDGKEITCYMPKLLTQASHLINISLLTNHIYILASGPLKNHFGTVRFSNFSQYPGCLHGDKIEEHIVDINLNPLIKHKTRLYICDGLFGVYARGEKTGIHRWNTFPGKNGIPNTLLFSLDPLTMEKKIADIITKERRSHGYKILSSYYLSDYQARLHS